MTNDEVPTTPAEAVTALANHLTATADRPVPPATNRWLGEAEAVSRDAATEGLDADIREKRVRQVAELLESAGETGDTVADDHLAAARACCEVILQDDEKE